jgi:hypothetical protein
MEDPSGKLCCCPGRQRPIVIAEFVFFGVVQRRVSAAWEGKRFDTNSRRAPGGLVSKFDDIRKSLRPFHTFSASYLSFSNFPFVTIFCHPRS